MRPIVVLTLLVAGLSAPYVVARPVPAAAEEDVAKDLRFLMLDGKFQEAGDKLANAPEEIRNDAKLRYQMAENAMRWCARKDPGEKIPGLVAARENYAAAQKLDTANAEAAQKAVETSLELTNIQIEAKQPDRAKEHALWAANVGDAALESGADSVDLRLAVAKAHDQHAKLSHKVQDFDAIVADYGRSADLLVSCADSAKHPADALAEAARVYLDLARFVAEGRPIDEEKRDDEALVKGLEVATRACEMKEAGKDEFTIHNLILREIHRAKMEGDFPHPYMQELGKNEGVDGLDVFVPKGDGWKALDEKGEWTLFYERKLDGDDTAVQIMIRAYDHHETFGGKSYDMVEDITRSRFEAQKTDDFADVASATEPEQIDTGKKGPEIWHYSIAGKMGSRRVRTEEWLMMRSKKEGLSYRIRLIDWRIVPDLSEPDIVEFVNRALGLAQDADEDPKGKKGKGKKPKKK